MTSIAEQADDAAGLLSALQTGPTLVFGNSLGAVIAHELVARHPQVVRGAIVHEPALYSLYPCAQDLAGFWQARLAEGGPSYAIEVLTGMKEDDVLEGLDPGLVRRVFCNGEVACSLEIPAILSHVPDIDAVSRSKVPLAVAAGKDTDMFYYGASRWLALRLEAEFHELPGGHTGYADRPEEFAEAVLPLLERLC